MSLQKIPIKSIYQKQLARTNAFIFIHNKFDIKIIRLSSSLNETFDISVEVGFLSVVSESSLNRTHCSSKT